MGHSDFNDHQYHQQSATRAAQGQRAFQYTETATSIHPSLDPRRIKDKINGILESRDSAEHPESVPVLLTIDVTGSNKHNAIGVQRFLPQLFNGLKAVLAHPQLAIAANDDYDASYLNALQISEFESGNEIDDWIRSLFLVGNGGGNGKESYDLLLYAAAFKIEADCWQKRGRKGYMFLYADEPFPTILPARQVREIFGTEEPRSMTMPELIAATQQKWDIHILWPASGQHHARQQYIQLFGTERVHTIESPDKFCEALIQIINQREAAPEQAAAGLMALSTDPVIQALTE